MGGTPQSSAAGASQPPEGYHAVAQVHYGDGMWWDMPAETSEELYTAYKTCSEYKYEWDYVDSAPQGTQKLGTRRDGRGRRTSKSDYTMDLKSLVQINEATRMKREIRIVFERDGDRAPE